jgi:hypothetical protein
MNDFKKVNKKFRKIKTNISTPQETYKSNSK